MNPFRLSKPVVIWGRGTRGRGLYRVLGQENVAVFIDEDVNKISQSDVACPTLSFESFLNSSYIQCPIVISSLYFEKAIVERLREHGLTCYFLLSDEVSELQGHGEKDFYQSIPLPSNKSNSYIIIGATLYACLCYEWFKYNGYSNVFIYTCNDEKRKAIVECFGYDAIDSIADINASNCYIATRRGLEHDLDITNITDIFDLSDYTDRYYNKKLLKYQGVHHEERCFIIGNGPSLRISDVSRLKGVHTFGVNRIYLLSTKWRPEYFVCVDNKVLEDENIYKYRVKTRFFSDRVKNRLNDLDEFVHVSQQFPFGEACLVPFSEDISRKVYSGGNVIYIAIQIAVYMGFAEIYLLGVDCDYPKNEKSHFYGDDFDLGGDPGWEMSMNTFKSARQYADAHGIKIFNATRGGKLEEFERVDFDSLDFINEKMETII